MHLLPLTRPDSIVLGCLGLDGIVLEAGGRCPRSVTECLRQARGRGRLELGLNWARFIALWIVALNERLR